MFIVVTVGYTVTIAVPLIRKNKEAHHGYSSIRTLSQKWGNKSSPPYMYITINNYRNHQFLQTISNTSHYIYCTLHTHCTHLVHCNTFTSYHNYQQQQHLLWTVAQMVMMVHASRGWWWGEASWLVMTSLWREDTNSWHKLLLFNCLWSKLLWINCLWS